jgi:ABC-type sugar transport system permease subunit
MTQFTATTVKTKPMRLAPSYKRRESLIQVLCIAPPIILLLALVGYPLVQTLYLSFMKSTLIQPQPVFVGLGNFVKIFSSSDFWNVFANSAVWTIVIVGLQFVLGMAAALILNRKFVGRGFLRAAVVIPWVMPGVIAGSLWKLLYEPYLGPIAQMLGVVGVPAENAAWLGNASTALFAVIVVAVWKGFPLSAVMYTAAYQNVPDELREAARLDGANAWQVFRNVVLPSMAPTIRSTMVLTTVWTFNYFDLIYVMTKGGPGDSTEIFPTAIYRLAFVDVNYGLSSAYGIVSVAVLGIFTVLYLRQLNKSGSLDR